MLCYESIAGLSRHCCELVPYKEIELNKLNRSFEEVHILSHLALEWGTGSYWQDAMCSLYVHMLELQPLDSERSRITITLATGHLPQICLKVIKNHLREPVLRSSCHLLPAHYDKQEKPGNGTVMLLCSVIQVSQFFHRLLSALSMPTILFPFHLWPLHLVSLSCICICVKTFIFSNFLWMLFICNNMLCYCLLLPALKYLILRATWQW